MSFYVWPLPALPVILAFRFQQQLALTLVPPLALLGRPSLHCTGILKRRGAVVQHLRFRGFAPGGGLAARGKPTTGQGRGLGASQATGGVRCFRPSGPSRQHAACAYTRACGRERAPAARACERHANYGHTRAAALALAPVPLAFEMPAERRAIYAYTRGDLWSRTGTWLWR